MKFIKIVHFRCGEIFIDEFFCEFSRNLRTHVRIKCKKITSFHTKWVKVVQTNFQITNAYYSEHFLCGYVISFYSQRLCKYIRWWDLTGSCLPPMQRFYMSSYQLLQHPMHIIPIFSQFPFFSFASSKSVR